MSNQYIIDYIHFHYVDKSKNPAKLKSGGTDKISSDIHDIYVKYIEDDLFEKKETKNCYDIFESTGSKNPQKSAFDSMLKRPIPQAKLQFEKDAVRSAKRLIKEMPASARSGVLFHILFRYIGKRYVCFLKLAWLDDSYLEYDTKTTKLKLKELVEKLPAKGKFQKGAIYPHPKTPSAIYMKVRQDDYPEANYFERFLGGTHEVHAHDMMTQLRDLAKIVTGKPLSPKQDMGLYEGIDAHLGQTRKEVKENDVIRIIQDALPSVRSKVKDRIKDKIKDTGMIRASQLVKLRTTFKVGAIQISGLYIDVRDNFHEKKHGLNKHQIDGKITKIKLRR